MNKKGHPDTLVAAHPENRNAVRSGVFSPATRAARVHELEAAIADRPVKEIVVDLLRREVAALLALAEAMDDSLSADGIQGRRGEPRNLISLRLRTNDKFRKTVEQYRSASEPAEAGGGQWWPRGAFMISPAEATRQVGAIADVALRYIDEDLQEQFLRDGVRATGGGELPE